MTTNDTTLHNENKSIWQKSKKHSSVAVVDSSPLSGWANVPPAMNGIHSPKRSSKNQPNRKKKVPYGKTAQVIETNRKNSSLY